MGQSADSKAGRPSAQAALNCRCPPWIVIGRLSGRTLSTSWSSMPRVARPLPTLTDCERFFADPSTTRQRQYEALRAFYLEHLPSAEAARRFGYSVGAFRQLCHSFRLRDLPEFFAIARRGPREQPKKSRARDQIIALRKRNYSVYEISAQGAGNTAGRHRRRRSARRGGLCSLAAPP
jgi:hypothetical protein